MTIAASRLGPAGRTFYASAFLLLLLCTPRPASALPSFAAQTGQPCSSCHMGSFGPALTPMGREFKLEGYSWDSGDSSAPKISAMLLAYLTHTDKGQPGGAAPHYHSNNNPSIDQLSLFYGGKILGNLGAMAQVTYDGVERHLAWDNVDIRYARSATIGDVDAIIGASVNNNPTVQDLWNSTPAWGTPFAAPALGPAPSAAPVITGEFAQQVVGSSVYAMWDDWLYTEVGAYGNLSNRAQTALGVMPQGENRVNGLAPYWRVAAQKEFGSNYASLGTFGLSAHVFPGDVRSAGSDRLTDLGFDATFDHQGGSGNDYSVYASFITEFQRLGASSALGAASNRDNRLHMANVTASYTRSDTYTFSLGYFDIWGSTDPLYYGDSFNGSPNSSGITAEADYTPFGKEDSSYAPYLNLRLGLQYTNYIEFNGRHSNYDGNGRDAADNNTLALMAWLIF